MRNPVPSSPTGFVRLVGACPGDADLITLRGWRALQEADVVLYDSLIDPRLLEGLRAPRLFVGKRCGQHAMSQPQINELLVGLALQGNQVVRLKGGDPCVLGRAGEEALALAEHGIPFEIVPGVTSASAVPALAGIPITHRGTADSFTVVAAHRRHDDLRFSIPPFHPRTTLIIMMGRSTVDDWRDQLLELGYARDLPVAFVSAGCTAREWVLVTCVEDAVEDLRRAALATPVLAVVGQVVRLRDRLAAGATREWEGVHRLLGSYVDVEDDSHVVSLG